jgi:hypothetical protein
MSYFISECIDMMWGKLSSCMCEWDAWLLEHDTYSDGSSVSGGNAKTEEELNNLFFTFVKEKSNWLETAKFSKFLLYCCVSAAPDKEWDHFCKTHPFHSMLKRNGDELSNKLKVLFDEESARHLI